MDASIKDIKEINVIKAICKQYICDLLLERDLNIEADRVYSAFQFGGTLQSELTGKEIDINRVPNGVISNEKFASLFISYDDSTITTDCIDLECTKSTFTNKKLTVTEQDVSHFKTLMSAGHSIQDIYCTYYSITANSNGNNRCVSVKDVCHTVVNATNVDVTHRVTVPTCTITKWDATRVSSQELLLSNILITDNKRLPNGELLCIPPNYYAEILNTLLDANDLTTEQYHKLYNSLIKDCLGLSMDDSKQLITRLIKEFSVKLDTTAKINEYNAELYQYANTEVARNSVSNTKCAVCSADMSTIDRVLSCGHCVCLECSSTVTTHCNSTVTVIHMKSAESVNRKPKRVSKKIN